MTPGSKKLQLKDLCQLLPYGTLVAVNFNDGSYAESLVLNTTLLGLFINEGLHTIKPYLRPMSDMTEDECKELYYISKNSTVEWFNIPFAPYYHEVADYNQIDWLNSHHLDYLGLIPKGLALVAPKGMYTPRI